MTSPLLSIQNLCAAYEDNEVVTDVSFDVAYGETVCIVGESGSGKSSLLNAIHGISSVEVTDGKVLFEGTDMCSLSPSKRKELLGPSIGLIPQNPAASFNPIRRYNVQFKEALTSHGLEYDEDAILSMLAEIGIQRDRNVLHARP